ncbi:MAG: S46 family peptidase, partial [Blastocatellia bacterium]
MNLSKSERTTPPFQPRDPAASSADSIDERPIRLTTRLSRRDRRNPGLPRKAFGILLLLLGGLCWTAMEARRPAAVRADEGMWTFDNPPLRQWRENYGFTPDQAWLDRLRLATVRLSEGAGGGTGCLVSPQGLLMTNQHVGRGQVSKLSSG